MSSILMNHFVEDNNIKSTNFNQMQSNIQNNLNARLIKAFYKDQIIFVTGGTGFLGKALIEKLLRSCDGIKSVYILLRSKNGLSSDLRFKEFLRNPVFDRLKAEKPHALEKLIGFSGDVIETNLGLSEADLQTIKQNVNIIFHSAATVKFNEGLKEATNLNACGTKRLMDLATEITSLKAIVHVSTAYCNPNRLHIEERVYPTTPPIENASFIKCVAVLPNDILESVVNHIKKIHPNTYTLTKSIAEQIVHEYASKFPICIIRPSIVTAALQEPYPGWVDNVQGITGIMVEIGRGSITTILGDKKLKVDIIPVDTVVNTMIAAAWDIGINGVPKFKVFNCTSGQIRPITWETLGNLTLKWSRINPTNYTTMYPSFSYRTNLFLHTVLVLLAHYLPAMIFDLFMLIQGQKPIMMRMAKKLKRSLKAGSFFSFHEWKFENKNQKELVHTVALMDDGAEFNCNIENLVYDDYVRNYMLGIRKYVLKEDEDSLDQARKRLSIIFWIRTGLQFLLLAVVFKYLMHLIL